MSKNRIMIVEDDNIVAADIQTSLEQANHEVVCTCSTGEDALEQAAKHLPDLILMDILLKDNMDGIESARIIYDRFNIPVVFLTAYSGSLTVDRAKTAHPYGYIVKPFDDHMLLTTIEIALYKHRAEKEANRKNQLYRQLLSTTSEAILAVDPERQTFLVANKTAETLLCRTQKDASLTLSQIIEQAYGEEFTKLEDGIARIASGQSDTLSSPRTLMNRDTGKTFQVTETLRAIKCEDLIEAVSVCLSQTCPETAKPRQGTENLYSLLYSNLLNRIRVPLDAIIGFTNLLSKTNMAPDQNGYVNTICESGREAAEIIDDIIMLSQLEPSRTEPEKINFDLERLVKNVIEQAQLRFLQHKISYSIEYDAALNTGFIGAPSRIRQILVILINFMAGIIRDMELTTRVSMEESNPDKNTARIAIAVKRPAHQEANQQKMAKIEKLLSDPNPEINKIDDVFMFRLTLAVHFSKLLNGKIRYTTDGQEDTIRFSVPLELTTPIVSQDITPLRLNELAGKRAIIIDDNPHACQVIETYCKSCKMDVIFVTGNAQHALDFLYKAQTVPDLILCDIMNADLDGYSLARKLRSMDTFNSAKLLAVTSDISPGSVARSQKSGFDAYLAKPINKGDFIRVVQTTLGDKRQKGQIITRHLSEELSLKGIKVLLAESNNVRMHIIDVLLKKFGCDVDRASTAEDVFSSVTEQKYNVCLLDLEMPELGAHEAVIRIRQELAPELPVITMSETPTSGQCAKLAGVYDFLLKPVDADQLRNTIIQCISHHHHAP